MSWKTSWRTSPGKPPSPARSATTRCRNPFRSPWPSSQLLSISQVGAGRRQASRVGWGCWRGSERLLSPAEPTEAQGRAGLTLTAAGSEGSVGLGQGPLEPSYGPHTCVLIFVFKTSASPEWGARGWEEWGQYTGEERTFHKRCSFTSTTRGILQRWFPSPHPVTVAGFLEARAWLS